MEETKQIKKNIYQKLLDVQKEILGLSKDKKTGGNGFAGYEYVTGNKLLSYLKPILNKQGLILKQEVVKVEKERIDYYLKNGNGKSEILYSVWQKFTWIDTETGERDENEFFASGMNEWEKGLGSALTYAERYFLLKYFHIATDEDDIDNPDRKPEPKPEKKEESKKEFGNKILQISEKQLFLLKKEVGKRGTEGMERLKELLYKCYCKKAEEIQIKDFNGILEEIKKIKETV